MKHVYPYPTPGSLPDVPFLPFRQVSALLVTPSYFSSTSFFVKFAHIKSTCGERRLADDINGSTANQSQSSSDVTFAGVDRKQEVKDGGAYERVRETQRNLFTVYQLIAAFSEQRQSIFPSSFSTRAGSPLFRKRRLSERRVS